MTLRAWKLKLAVMLARMPKAERDAMRAAVLGIEAQVEKQTSKQMEM